MKNKNEGIKDEGQAFMFGLYYKLIIYTISKDYTMEQFGCEKESCEELDLTPTIDSTPTVTDRFLERWNFEDNTLPCPVGYTLPLPMRSWCTWTFVKFRMDFII